MSRANHTFSLKVSDLEVQRAGNIILAGVSFELSAGQALILRGENGAGKTSLLRALAGFAHVSHGTMHFFEGNNEVEQEAACATAMHYLGHENGISLKLSPIENMKFWAMMMAPARKDQCASIIDEVGLTFMQREKAHRLSAGQKRRLAIGRLRLAPRPIWLLDEPATALDTAGQELLLAACAKHRAQGGIIIMTTHGSFTLPDAKGLFLTAPEVST